MIDIHGKWIKPDKKECNSCYAKFSEDCRIIREKGGCKKDSNETDKKHCDKRATCTIFKRYPDRCIDDWDLCFWLK